jgi:hypothetical protein
MSALSSETHADRNSDKNHGQAEGSGHGEGAGGTGVEGGGGIGAAESPTAGHINSDFYNSGYNSPGLVDRNVKNAASFRFSSSIHTLELINSNIMFLSF